MPFRDVTKEFLEIVHDKTSAIPESKKKKFVPQDISQNGNPTIEKNYVAEAQNILNHIHTLTKMLGTIRTAYLTIDPRGSSLSRQPSRNIDLGEGSSSWANIRHLSNEERDQIDLQARVILTRCSDRIKDMEALEKRRAEVVANRTHPLTRLLPARLRQDEASLYSGVIAAHHASITWYLSRRLTEASQTQKELQEERIKRQLERTRSLGSGAAQEVLSMHARPLKRTSSHSSSVSSTARGPGGWLENTIGAAIGANSQQESQRGSPAFTPESRMISDDEDDEIELSASQIMQFEAENANILKSVQDTLESVQQAEARLMDISALQMELVTRLTQQTELTDQLYEDALTATSTVEKGNEQLKEAKRRAKDSRLFILVFLLGASFSLLFLHYY